MTTLQRTNLNHFNNHWHMFFLKWDLSTWTSRWSNPSKKNITCWSNWVHLPQVKSGWRINIDLWKWWFWKESPILKGSLDPGTCRWIFQSHSANMEIWFHLIATLKFSSTSLLGWIIAYLHLHGDHQPLHWAQRRLPLEQQSHVHCHPLAGTWICC